MTTPATRTTTIPAPQPTLLHLTLRVPPAVTPRSKTCEIHQKMVQSGCFEAAELNALNEWKASLLPIIPDQFKSEAERQTVSLALTVLIDDIVNEALLKNPIQSKEEQLWLFEGELKEILQMALPTGKDLRAYLAEHEQSVVNATVQAKGQVLINAFFQELMLELVIQANAVKAEINLSFAAMKQEISEARNQRQAAAKKIEDQLDQLISRVVKLQQNLKERALKAQELSDRIEHLQDSMRQLANEAKEFIQQLPNSVHIPLQPTGTAKQRTCELLKHMTKSGCFTLEDLQVMKEWALGLLPLIFTEMNSEEAQKNASLAFAILIKEIIGPAFQKTQDSEKKELLISFENELLEILKLTLPPGQTLSTYLPEYEECVRRAEAFKKDKEQVALFIQEQMQTLVNEANALKAEIQRNLDSLKEKVTRVKNNDQALVQKVQEELNKLSVKVEKVQQNMRENACKSQEFAHQVEQHQQNLRHFINHTQEQLNQVRI